MIAEQVAVERTEQGMAEKPLICFVCTGNTCRSPMAEALINGAGGSYRAISAGLAPCVGAPIAEHAVEALMLSGVLATPENPYTDHKAQALSPELVEQADLIVGMTPSHLMQILACFPQMATKVHAMPLPIPDPYMGDLAEYRACLARIEAGLKEAGWLC